MCFFAYIMCVLYFGQLNSSGANHSWFIHSFVSVIYFQWKGEKLVYKTVIDYLVAFYSSLSYVHSTLCKAYTRFGNASGCADGLKPV